MKKNILILILIISALNPLFSSELNQQRIISLIPSQTELLFELGFGDKIVGVSDYCNYPNQAKAIAKVGAQELNIEKIMSLRPTLLLDLNSMHKKYAPLFKQLGLNYVDLTISKLSDIPVAAKQISEILADPSKSSPFIKNWNMKIAEINIQNHKIPKVYLEIWDNPMQAAGPLSFMGELIEAAGGENIITNQSDYPIVNSEHIISGNPEIILIAYPLPTPDTIKIRPGWQNIDAVKTNRIYTLDQDIFVRPGPRNLEALAFLSKLFNNK